MNICVVLNESEHWFQTKVWRSIVIFNANSKHVASLNQLYIRVNDLTYYAFEIFRGLHFIDRML